MVQIEVWLMLGCFRTNVILVWFLVFLGSMLLKYGLLVWFMSLEEKKCVVDISLDLESFGLLYVLVGLF